jgi:hypothetical protein
MLPFTVVHRYQTTWRHISEDRNPYTHSRENLKSRTELSLRLEAGLESPKPW